MPFVLWLLLGTSGILGYSAVTSRNPAAVTRAIVRGEDPRSVPRDWLTVKPVTYGSFQDTFSNPSGSTGGGGNGGTVVARAQSQLGKPYKWAGGDSKGPTRGGFDCSGLTLYAYAGAGIMLPHSSQLQALMGTKVSAAEAKPGDLVFFGLPVHHVGIVTGPGQMIHAPESGDVVKQSAIWNEHTQYRTYGAGTKNAPRVPE